MLMKMATFKVERRIFKIELIGEEGITTQLQSKHEDEQKLNEAAIELIKDEVQVNEDKGEKCGSFVDPFFSSESSKSIPLSCKITFQ